MKDIKVYLNNVRLEVKKTLGLTDETFVKHFEDITFGDEVTYENQFHTNAYFLGIEYINGEPWAWLMVSDGKHGFTSYPKIAEKILKNIHKNTFLNIIVLQ